MSPPSGRWPRKRSGRRTSSSTASSGTAWRPRSKEGEATMKIGFIGLGLMGSSMAPNARAGGHELTVHDLRGGAVAPPLAAGAKWAATPRLAAEGADVVFTSLPGPREVASVALAHDGHLAGLR